ECRPGSGRPLDGAGQRPVVRPFDGGRSPVFGRRAGRADRAAGCPLGAGGRTLGRGRDPRPGRPDTDRAVLQALKGDQPGAEPRGRGGDQGAQGIRRVRGERLPAVGGRACGAGVGERQLTQVCSGGRGRPASRTELGTALDTLAGPDGLTGQVSTFTRTDVVDALAKRLPVAPTAQDALNQIEEAADRSWPSGPSRSLTTAGWASTAIRRRSCWPLSGTWSTAPPSAPTRAAPPSGRTSSARSWNATPPPGR